MTPGWILIEIRLSIEDLLSARLSGTRPAECKASGCSKGLDECKALLVKDIIKEVKDIVKEVEDIINEVEDIVKEVEDILISWDRYQLICRKNTLKVLKKIRGGNTLTILLPFEEEQAELLFPLS
nr:hypothetical protein [Tanacetum cinerariifolium]